MSAIPDSITALRCEPGRRASKRVTELADGSVAVAGYDAGAFFAVDSKFADGIHALAAILDDTSEDPLAFVIRGQPLVGIDRARCRRLLYKHQDGTPPTFRDVPRRWAIIDFDNVPGPYRFDPRDGELAAIYCRTLLPEPWQRCSYWWGLSSSAGFKPGVRIKLAFWLDRPCTGRELERALTGSPIDESTLRTVQPIYVARPILVGVADPVRCRTGFEEDIHDLVTVPVLPAEALAPERDILSSEGRRYVSGDTPDMARSRLQPLCQSIERARVGDRHRCLMWAAVRAVELDDAIPRAEIAAELITAARRAGIEDSADDLARQVRNGFKIGIFGAEAV